MKSLDKKLALSKRMVVRWAHKQQVCLCPVCVYKTRQLPVCSSTFAQDCLEIQYLSKSL